MRKFYWVDSVLDEGSLEEIRGWRNYKRETGIDIGIDKEKERERKGNSKRR